MTFGNEALERVDTLSPAPSVQRRRTAVGVAVVLALALALLGSATQDASTTTAAKTSPLGLTAPGDGGYETLGRSWR